MILIFCSPYPAGRQFSGQIIPSATVLVVGVGRSEAKVEGVFSEVCRLDYMGNVFDSMGGEVLKGDPRDEEFEDKGKPLVSSKRGGMQPTLYSTREHLPAPRVGYGHCLPSR